METVLRAPIMRKPFHILTQQRPQLIATIAEHTHIPSRISTMCIIELKS